MKDNGEDTTTIVVGKVATSKNPYLHPSDIRVLQDV